MIKMDSHPNTRAVFDVFERELKLMFNCHAIGRIEQFNAAAQTAQVSILYKRTMIDQNGNDYDLDYPILADVPVVMMSGGAAGLTFPISAGDECILMFNDRDIDNWWNSGQNGRLLSSRLHSFADAIALIGPRSQQKKFGTYDQQRAVLFNGTTMVGVGSSLVKIANSQYTLGTLINNLNTQLGNLVTAIAAITVTGVQTGAGVSGAPANATAISNIGTQISQIATQLQGLLE